MAWNDKDIAILKDGWAAGLTSGLIMRKLGGRYSRSAVVGKAHRLGLDSRLNPVNDRESIFERVCDRVIDDMMDLDAAAIMEGMHPTTASRLWEERIVATHGGPPVR